MSEYNILPDSGWPAHGQPTPLERLLVDMSDRIDKLEAKPDPAKILDDLVDAIRTEALDAYNCHRGPVGMFHNLAKGIAKIREDNFGERSE